MWKLTELAQQLKGQLQGNDTLIERVSTDTRTLKAGDLFLALIGENFNGHEFLAQAQAQGAVAALVSQEVTTSLPVIRVEDTRLALGQLAAWHRQQYSLPLIALTGSCGKTTVKEMLRTILSECGLVLANAGTLNNEIGVPLTLLQLNEQHRYAVIELGANHPGEIAYLSSLARPEVAFINNIAPAHLEGFGSVEGVAWAKAEIFQNLAAHGTALINLDDAYAQWLQQLLVGRAVVTFGWHEAADIQARDVHMSATGACSFTLHTPQGQVAIELAVLGRHNVTNALAAAAAALQVGIPLAAIKIGLAKTQPVAGRLVTRAGIAGARILDDTYNANPASVKAAIQVLAQQTGERILVIGDMLELGATAHSLHEEIGHFAREQGIQTLYAYGVLTRHTVAAFGANAYHYDSHAALAEALRPQLHPAVTILVKGSRSSKMETIVALLQVTNAA